MEAGNDGTTRRAAADVAGSRAFQVIWAMLLSGAIVSAGLKVLPAPTGRAVLWLIGIGFLLFTIARASMQAVESAPSFSARLLPPRMRRLYWSGYTLMAVGVVLAAAASAASLLR